MRLCGAAPAMLFSLWLLPSLLAQNSFAQTAESSATTPIAIVPVGGSATVTGALQVTLGKALIASAGTITSGAENTEVTLPRRGLLRVCASTSIKLTADTGAAGETPGLMMALDRGAIEASFATVRNSDVLLTPDFRILIGGPGAVELKVRLGVHGDTCVDNPGANAPYVVVSSVFDGGAYRVQPGQRVIFQHGSLHEVIDQEQESCGCPPTARPGTNDFPVAESAGLTMTPPPVLPAPMAPSGGAQNTPNLTPPMVYQAPGSAAPATLPQLTSDPKVAQPSPTSGAPAARKKPGFFRRLGGFFRKVFGAE